MVIKCVYLLEFTGTWLMQFDRICQNGEAKWEREKKNSANHSESMCMVVSFDVRLYGNRRIICFAYAHYKLGWLLQILQYERSMNLTKHVTSFRGSRECIDFTIFVLHKLCNAIVDCGATQLRKYNVHCIGIYAFMTMNGQIFYFFFRLRIGNQIKFQLKTNLCADDVIVKSMFDYCFEINNAE